MLKALRVVVESNVALASGNEEQLKKLPEAARDAPISREEAAANVRFLQTQVESWLAVLFNVFSSSGRESQGTVADVIAVWVSIADAKVYNFYIALCIFWLNKLCTGNCEGVSEAHLSPQAESRIWIVPSAGWQGKQRHSYDS